MNCNKYSLSFFTLNVEGLQTKLEDPCFVEHLYRFDFVVLVETWLPCDFRANIDGVYAFSKYRVKHPRAKRHSGGITILVKKEFRQGVKFVDTGSDMFVWWKLDIIFFNV